MPDETRHFNGQAVLLCDPAGPLLSTTQDALDLIGATYFGAETIAIPVQRVDERFFDLETGLAGELMQKFVNYSVRLVILGDISAPLASSSALRSLVRESNRGSHIWFLPDLAALTDRLAAAA